MTLDEAIEHAREVAGAKYAEAVECANAYDRAGAEACHECRKEHAQLADWLEELRQRRAAEQDSLDAMCGQIEKVVRTESDDDDWYAALLRDGSWVHFHTMNDVLRRFIFDSKHCQHSGVTFAGQAEYTR